MEKFFLYEKYDIVYEKNIDSLWILESILYIWIIFFLGKKLYSNVFIAMYEKNVHKIMEAKRKRNNI